MKFDPSSRRWQYILDLLQDPITKTIWLCLQKPPSTMDILRIKNFSDQGHLPCTCTGVSGTTIGHNDLNVMDLTMNHLIYKHPIKELQTSSYSTTG